VTGVAGFGATLASISDHDGDGYRDLLVGAPDTESERGEVYLFSAGRGHLLGMLRGEVQGGRFGDALATLPDVTGDGREEILVGAPDTIVNGNADAGRATVWSFDPNLPGRRSHFGTGCTPPPFTGQQPWLSTSLGQPRIGKEWRLGVRRGLPGTLAIFALDFTPQTAPLPLCVVTPLFPCNCQLLVNASLNGNMAITGKTLAQGDGMGLGEFPIQIPNNPTLPGLSLYAQCLMLAGFPGPLTDGMQVVIQ
jgi:hypothetical protein